MSSNRQKLVKEFISVTGSDQTTAKHLLDACSDNLERAIEMYLDDKTETPGASTNTTSNEDNVRAPIPQTSGVLVDDPHYLTTSRDRWRPRRRPRSVFDGFRDFKAETTQQEALLSNVQGRNPGRKRLEDLFRPPLDLMHRGTLETARESGRISNKWLMVNVQNVREFSCQVLNRDVWSKPNIQKLIKKHFIFWQVYNDSTEGDRFTTFYPVNSWPHVTILDPRTGERLAVWTQINTNNIEGKVAEFLADHGSMEDEDEISGPPLKKNKRESRLLIDDSEDTQLAAAIAASLVETASRPTTVINSDLDEDYIGSNDESSDASAFGVSSEDDIFIHDSDSVDGNSNNTAIRTEKSLKSDENSLQQTKVDEKYFPEINHKNSSPSECENGTLIRSSSDENDDKKLYKKVKSKLKIGSIPNGKDMSSLTNDIYADPSSQTEANGHKLKPEDICRIMVRYPDGAREEISMDVNLTLEALSSELIRKGYPREDYDLMTHFPRKNMYSLGLDKTLKEAGLHPRSTVFVEEIER